MQPTSAANKPPIIKVSTFDCLLASLSGRGRGEGGNRGPPSRQTHASFWSCAIKIQEEQDLMTNQCCCWLGKMGYIYPDTHCTSMPEHIITTVPDQVTQLTVTTLVDILRRKYRSWETAMTAPSNFTRASSSISLEGMSKWLVGSSSTRKVP